MASSFNYTPIDDKGEEFLDNASGGWLILILLGYLGSLGWGHVLGLFVLFGIGVASLLTGKRRT